MICILLVLLDNNFSLLFYWIYRLFSQNSLCKELLLGSDLSLQLLSLLLFFVILPVGLAVNLTSVNCRFFNNFNFFKSQETVNVLRLDFSELKLSICTKSFLQNFEKTKKRRHFQDDLQPLPTNYG